MIKGWKHIKPFIEAELAAGRHSILEIQPVSPGEFVRPLATGDLLDEMLEGR